MTKRKTFFLLAFMAILTIILSISGNLKTYALDHSTASVTTSYIDYETLDDAEKKNLIQGLPNTVIQHDTEAFILVYKKSAIIPISTNDAMSSGTTSKKENLPKTGEKSVKLLIVIGVCLTLFTGVLIYKSRQAKNLILLVLALGSITEINNVSAQELNSFPDKKVVTYSTGSAYSESAPEVSGYEYIGYIHHFIDSPEPIKQGNVKVRYVDEQDKELVDSKILTGVVGNDYQTLPEDIDGYALVTTPSNAIGKFENLDQTVSYTYKLIDKSATIVVRFVDGDGRPFSIAQLINKGYTSVEYGARLVAITDNELSKYTVELDYNHQSYQQGEVVKDISIPLKIGDAYSLPDMVKFIIKDESGTTVSALYAPQPDGSMFGPSDWRTYDSPTNTSGTILEKEMTVTYVIKSYGAAIPAP